MKRITLLSLCRFARATIFDRCFLNSIFLRLLKMFQTIFLDGQNKVMNALRLLVYPKVGIVGRFFPTLHIASIFGRRSTHFSSWKANATPFFEELKLPSCS